MYQMIKAKGLVASISQEAPPGISAFIIAEFFYKFHSFTLECLAFLATWFVFSWLVSKLCNTFKYKNREVSHD